VSDIGRAIATEMNLSKDRIEGIRVAGVLHDLGKVSIPGDILSKPGQLTKVEFDLIKTHPEAGYNILKSVDFE
jgi:HD-GYP domain-containing protein (c-di-GMP phosphodiesterase class II)